MHSKRGKTKITFPQPQDVQHTNPCKLGTHLLCLFDETGLEQILGTLGVDEAVSSVETLGLVHPASSFTDVTRVLNRKKKKQVNLTSLWKSSSRPECVLPYRSSPWSGRALWGWGCFQWLRWCIREQGSVCGYGWNVGPGNTEPRVGKSEAQSSHHLQITWITSC